MARQCWFQYLSSLIDTVSVVAERMPYNSNFRTKVLHVFLVYMSLHLTSLIFCREVMHCFDCNFASYNFRWFIFKIIYFSSRCLALLHFCCTFAHGLCRTPPFISVRAIFVQLPRIWISRGSAMSSAALDTYLTITVSVNGSPTPRGLLYSLNGRSGRRSIFPWAIIDWSLFSLYLQDTINSSPAVEK